VIVRIGRRDPPTVYEVEVTSGIHATRPIGVPTWEDFKQRHFIDGIPLPVRPRRREQVLRPRGTRWFVPCRRHIAPSAPSSSSS
jgi:hypothetical protein